MLATLVIGLREGLEAALIVGIIAAFLRRNGKSLTAMWLGVALAIILSVAVGVSLELIERELPQAGQEGMETVIGAIAIFFVTGMIVWMNAHARDMKRQLEAQATQALTQAGAYALASMAFLAVLKEGFETSVFLLATFSAAQSAAWAATGAIIGLLMAAVIGWGIYAGGVRINLSRFFRFTGAFLILVAAGLTITSLRTAHEAGWLNIGQQTTVNLSWLVAPGTVQSALITGVLGIPADPRLIEVTGWLAYLVPIALFLYWPQSLRPRPRTALRLQSATAVALAAAALALFVLLPRPQPRLPAQATIVAVTGAAATDATASPAGTVRLVPAATESPPTLQVFLTGADKASIPLPRNQRTRERHDGIDSFAWSLARTAVPAHAPSTLTLDEVITLSGGRIPVGLNPAEHPGPFTADWSTRSVLHIWTAEDRLLDAIEDSITVVTLSGSGLSTPRTLTATRAGLMAVDAGGHAPAGNWRVAAAYRNQAAAELNNLPAARRTWRFWALQIPLALALAALLLAAYAGRTLARLRRTSGAAPAATATPAALGGPAAHGRRLADGPAVSSTIKGTPRAAH
jgi:high-affinity iron transporter